MTKQKQTKNTSWVTTYLPEENLASNRLVYMHVPISRNISIKKMHNKSKSESIWLWRRRHLNHVFVGVHSIVLYYDKHYFFYLHVWSYIFQYLLKLGIIILIQKTNPHHTRGLKPNTGKNKNRKIKRGVGYFFFYYYWAGGDSRRMDSKF